MRLPKTKHGADPFEVISALQKCIRRGMEREALTFAFEMGLSSPAYFSMALNRLYVTAHEDIGVADINTVVFAVQTLDKVRFFFDAKKSDWQTLLTNAVVALARARKCRTADHLACLVLYNLEKGLPPIPDFALDMHTSRGRRLGRGIVHFLKEGAALLPVPDLRCQYQSEAEAMWLLTYAAKGKGDFDPVSGSAEDGSQPKRSAAEMPGLFSEDGK